MTVFTDSFDDSVVHLLKEGGIGIIRTDTLYGVVARAEDEAAVERVFAAKGRTPTKSPIVLIGSVSQLLETYSESTMAQLATVWPGKNSVILPAKSPDWLTRGNASIAYRLPDDQMLRQLVQKVGPLAAPSANPEGEPPAMTIAEAKDYFGDQVDFYVDGGTVADSTPSKLYRLHANNFERLR